MGRGGGGAGVTSLCARKLSTLKGGKFDHCRKKTCLYVTCLVLFIILEGLMLYVVCNTIFRCGNERVEALVKLLSYMDRKIENTTCSYHY